MSTRNKLPASRPVSLPPLYCGISAGGKSRWLEAGLFEAFDPMNPDIENRGRLSTALSKNERRKDVGFGLG